MPFETVVYTNTLLDLVDRGLLSVRSAKLDIHSVCERTRDEGMSFLTKTLPSLGKALDSALLTNALTIPSTFPKAAGSELPLFLGDLFNAVFSSDGTLKGDASPSVIRTLRELLFLFYKYELPHTADVEGAFIGSFIETDETLATLNFSSSTIQKVSLLLEALLSDFDPYSIIPRHGPGATADKAIGPGKYDWGIIPDKLSDVYGPEYFSSCFTEVSDTLGDFYAPGDRSLAARVVLVPKDSRGPRVISCEPKVNQWIQQGLMRGLVDHIESHPLTKGKVNFTDQTINGRLALLSSRDGAYATLDLAEASDRVCHRYVAAVFPPHIMKAMDACRSESTLLPDGRTIKLNKFAPMGSALCFPVMALVIWSVLVSHGVFDTYVYGDDIVVPTAQAEQATKALESIGLKVNKSKSCKTGFFRESCGCDAYKGVDVTPVRIRAVWSVTPSYDHFYSWVATANSLYNRGYLRASRMLAHALVRQYGPIVQDRTGDFKSAPAFCFEIIGLQEPPTRYNRQLQKMERLCLVALTRSTTYTMRGYVRLLRFFTEGGNVQSNEGRVASHRSGPRSPGRGRGPTDEYTHRGDIYLRKRWI